MPGRDKELRRIVTGWQVKGRREGRREDSPSPSLYPNPSPPLYPNPSSPLFTIPFSLLFDLRHPVHYKYHLPPFPPPPGPGEVIAEVGKNQRR
ncbi:hypothetical protein Pcinc_036291 [Petrolisthes cinctipes]|uniref:Uncharacterized protein n=1 Tax=Petrolisthes cinctipes TaxID=88211 RepID=A0AAE1EMQ3_PETCI|nr:hypothetical protein Pcinc_036291 [Petrolisthes cinctipes]